MKLANLPLDPIEVDTIPQDVSGLESIIRSSIGFLTILAGLTFLFWFIFGAYSWITAEGKPDKLEKARNHLIHATTGLIIAIAAFAVTALLGSIFGLDIFNLKDTIDSLSILGQ